MMLTLCYEIVTGGWLQWDNLPRNNSFTYLMSHDQNLFLLHNNTVIFRLLKYFNDYILYVHTSVLFIFLIKIYGKININECYHSILIPSVPVVLYFIYKNPINPFTFFPFVIRGKIGMSTKLLFCSVLIFSFLISLYL